MAEIQTVYVRIRPDTRGFRGEATRQLRPQLAGVSSEARKLSGATKDATENLGRFTRGTVAANAAAVGLTRAVGFASTAFIGGIGLGAAIRTATDEFTESVRVNSEVAAGIKSTGGVANVTAQQIDKLAESTLALTGQDDELVKQGASILLTFRKVRNEVGAGNDIFNQALKATSDLAARFRTDLSSEAIRLGRALEDPVRGVTALRRAGITFTAAQQKTIKGLVDTGRLLAAQRLILKEVEVQVGGTAEAFGRTLPGQLRILRENAVNSLGELVRRLSESEEAAGIASRGLADLKEVGRGVAAVVRTIGPPLLDVAKFARQLVDAVGVPTILAAVAAYKAVGLAVTLQSVAQARYNAVLAAGIPVQRAATVSTLQYAAAQTVSTRATTAAAGAGGLRAFGAGLLATVGKANLVTLALAATAGGVIFLTRQQSTLERSNERVRNSLGLLDTELERSADLRRKLRDATGAVETDKLALASAKLGVEQARQAFASETAAKGSLNYRLAQLRLVEAENAVRTAESQLQIDRNTALRTEREQAAAAETRRANIGRQITDVQELIRLTEQQSRQVGVGKAQPLFKPNDVRVILDTAAAFRENAEAAGGIRTASGRAGLALAQLTEAMKAVPTSKQIRIIVEAADAGKSLGTILELLGLISEASAGLRSAGLVEDIRDAFRNPADALSAQATRLRELKAAANLELAQSKKSLANVREIRRERSRALREQRDALQAEREALNAARQSVLDAQQALADAIRAGNQAVTDAVQQAKQNLSSVGQSLSSAIKEFLDRTDETSAPTGALAKRFQELRKRIAEGQGGPETQRAAQEIAARLQAQQVGRRGQGAEQLERRFADVTALFNRGSIGLQQFNRRINAILKELGVTAGAVERRSGPAAGEEIRALIRGIREQATAIATGPQRAGAGLEVSIVRPIETLRESQRQIADAEKQLAQAHLDVSKAANRLHEQTLATQRATYAQVAAERAEARAGRRLERARLDMIERNTRPKKPNSGAAKDARDNARVQGNAP